MSNTATMHLSDGLATTTWRIEPKGFLSRHFALYCDDELITTLRMQFLREGCDFVIAGHAFSIHRTSMWRDRFQLLAGGAPVCDVMRKPWSRRFELTTNERAWTLRPTGWFMRTYQLLANGNEVGTIGPAGWFTRRSIAVFSRDVPPPVQTLAIFLVLIVSRRQNNSAGS